MRSGVMRTNVRLRRPCRIISCPAAKGIRCVKPSSATVAPSRTCRAIASASERNGIGRISASSAIFASRGWSRQEPGTPCDNRAVLPAVIHEGNPDFVLSLARGLSVIEAFQTRTEGATVGDISARTGLSRAAVRRLLITLELLGYASHSGPVYRLSSRVLRLGFSYLSSNSLSTLAAPILEEIAAALDESSSLSILEGDQIVYVARSA